MGMVAPASGEPRQDARPVAQGPRSAAGCREDGGMIDKARWLLLLGYALAVLGIWIIEAKLG
jgi:hypothetical protein